MQQFSLFCMMIFLDILTPWKRFHGQLTLILPIFLAVVDTIAWSETWYQRDAMSKICGVCVEFVFRSEWFLY